MKARPIMVLLVITVSAWHIASAAPKKTKIQMDAPPLESILKDAKLQSNPVLAELVDLKPVMPLGPQDVLRSYEVAMNMVTDKTSSDFAVIVQAHQANQITRDQAEYLCRRRTRWQ